MKQRIQQVNIYSTKNVRHYARLFIANVTFLKLYLYEVFLLLSEIGFVFYHLNKEVKTYNKNAGTTQWWYRAFTPSLKKIVQNYP